MLPTSDEGSPTHVSGSGNVAQYTVQKLLELGAKVLTLSDSSGYIHDAEGIGEDKLRFVMDLKNVRRGRLKEYTEEFKSAVAGIQYDEGLTGDAIRAQLDANGAGDLFPSLSAADLARIAAETKIPVADSWADRVRAGTASWDGLLSEAALASFHTDQMALDDRIRDAI